MFSLSGPLARDLVIAVDGGRASLVDPAPAAPTVTIATDTETFARLAAGRIHEGDVTFVGDADLGQRVVAHMNYLF